MREPVNWEKIQGKYQLFYKLIQSGNLAKDILDLGAPSHPHEPTQFINKDILDKLYEIRGKLAHYSYAMTLTEKNEFITNMQAYLEKYQDLQTAKAEDDKFKPLTSLYAAQARVDGYLNNPALSPLAEDKQLKILIQWLKFIDNNSPDDSNLHILSMVWIDIGNLLKKCVTNDDSVKKNCRRLVKLRNDLAHDYNIYFNSHDLKRRLSQHQADVKTSGLIAEFESMLTKVKPAQAAKASSSSSYAVIQQKIPPVAANAADQTAIAASASSVSQSSMTTVSMPQAKKRLARFKLPVPEEEQASVEQREINQKAPASASSEQGGANLEGSSPPSSEDEEPHAKRFKV